jgi:hypothetical protein
VAWLWLCAPTYDQFDRPGPFAGEIAAFILGAALILGGLSWAAVKCREACK